MKKTNIYLILVLFILTSTQIRADSYFWYYYLKATYSFNKIPSFDDMGNAYKLIGPEDSKYLIIYSMRFQGDSASTTNVTIEPKECQVYTYIDETDYDMGEVWRFLFYNYGYQPDSVYESYLAKQTKYFEGTYPVKESNIYWKLIKNYQIITSISYPENIRVINDQNLENVKELHYYPHTLFGENVDYRLRNLQYLTIWDNDMLDHWQKGMFYSIKSEREWHYNTVDNDWYDYWWEVDTCKTLEYLVSYMDIPTPRSFYKDEHSDKEKDKYGNTIPGYNYHMCIFGKDLSELDLYVPEGSIELYRQTTDWNKFRNIYPLTDKMKERYDEVMETLQQVSETSVTNSNEVKRWYSINGQALLAPQKGINIAVMRDGTVRKIYKK